MHLALVVLLAGFLPGCVTLAGNLAMGLGISAMEVGLGGLENSFVTKTKKIETSQLAQLKPGMTKDEVNGILQKPPMMTSTTGDGGSMATYTFNSHGGPGRDGSMMGVFGIMGAFSKSDRESQNVTIQFDSKGRYVTHTVEETRVCGSQATGYFVDNCEIKKTAGVN
ncbi:MAG: outer membrane protein assembly factor BamE [bacterium]|nr:outer membrane protein assembly factor BamE [bacterium]